MRDGSTPFVPGNARRRPRPRVVLAALLAAFVIAFLAGFEGKEFMILGILAFASLWIALGAAVMAVIWRGASPTGDRVAGVARQVAVVAFLCGAGSFLAGIACGLGGHSGVARCRRVAERLAESIEERRQREGRFPAPAAVEVLVAEAGYAPRELAVRFDSKAFEIRFDAHVWTSLDRTWRVED